MRIALLVAFCLLGGCPRTKEMATPKVEGTSMDIRVGDKVSLASGSVLLVEAVESDHRCPPPPTRCGASGWLKLRVTLDGRPIMLSLQGATERTSPWATTFPTGDSTYFEDATHAYVLVRVTPFPAPPVGALATFVKRPRTIGTATLTTDETIVLDLIAEADDGTRGHGQLRYPKDHAEYRAISQHVGPVFVGRYVRVFPFEAK